MDLDWWADVATVVSSAATILIALIGGGGAVAYVLGRRRLRRMSKAVEDYLRDQKAAERNKNTEVRNKGQRSAENICRYVQQGLTEDEMFEISQKNPRIQMRVRTDKDGFADRRLYEYVGG
jgi:hypothetical protein